MSDLISFAEVGFRHIADLNAADHILFLLVLSVLYNGRDWRSLLWVASAFTVGHSITLALAVTNVLVLNGALVEFLIPVTIVVTGLENFWLRSRAQRGGSAAAGTRYRPVLAVFFGFIHGAGFAGYLRSLFVDDLAIPLLGFNLGIELGQIVVLLAAGALYAMLDRIFAALAAGRGRDHTSQAATSTTGGPADLRVITISAAAMLIAGAWAWTRLPL